MLWGFFLCSGIEISISLYFLWKVYTRTKQGFTASTRISILVCVHNEQENITDLWTSLAQQSDQDFDLIWVNDRSTDKTEALLQEYTSKNQGKIISITHTPENWAPKKWAVYQGALAAHTEWILVTDADCRPSAHWVRDMRRAMTKKVDFVLGISPYLPQKSLLNLIIRQETLQTAYLYIGLAAAGLPYMAVGRNMAWRKTYLMDKGMPYTDVLSGDDDLFLQTAKKNRVAVVLESPVMSIPKQNWSDWHQQKKRHISAGKKYKKLILSFLTLYHINHLSIFVLGFWCLIQQNILSVILVFTVRILAEKWIFSLFFQPSRLSIYSLEFIFWDIFQIPYQMYIGLLGLFKSTKQWS